MLHKQYIMEVFSTRQNKVSRLVQKELADYFLRETKNLYQGKLISVTTVRVTKDLGLAKVYLSIFPSDGSESILDNIKESGKLIRGWLGRKIGKQVRVTPVLQFYIDDSNDYIENIDKILGNK